MDSHIVCVDLAIVNKNTRVTAERICPIKK